MPILVFFPPILKLRIGENFSSDLILWSSETSCIVLVIDWSVSNKKAVAPAICVSRDSLSRLKDCLVKPATSLGMLVINENGLGLAKLSCKGCDHPLQGATRKSNRQYLNFGIIRLFVPTIHPFLNLAAQPGTASAHECTY